MDDNDDGMTFQDKHELWQRLTRAEIEVLMVERSERGKAFRRYLLDVVDAQTARANTH